jgi:positive regulator of sigma E activity
VKRHHLLLVTLLVANAAAMEALPLFVDRIVGTVGAILISVTAVLLFGEYARPHATRHDTTRRNAQPDDDVCVE